MSYASYATLITRALDQGDAYADWTCSLGQFNRDYCTRLAEYLYERMHRAGHCCHGQSR